MTKRDPFMLDSGLGGFILNLGDLGSGHYGKYAPWAIAIVFTQIGGPEGDHAARLCMGFRNGVTLGVNATTKSGLNWRPIIGGLRWAPDADDDGVSGPAWFWGASLGRPIHTQIVTNGDVNQVNGLLFTPCFPLCNPPLYGVKKEVEEMLSPWDHFKPKVTAAFGYIWCGQNYMKY